MTYIFFYSALGLLYLALFMVCEWQFIKNEFQTSRLKNRALFSAFLVSVAVAWPAFLLQELAIMANERGQK